MGSIARFAWIISVAFLLPMSGLAQQTSIDLRKDGRVISGARKDFIVQRARSYSHSLAENAKPQDFALRISNRLRNKLLNSEVVAIIVPPGPIDGKYLVGLLIGNETLPDDCEIDEGDFKQLRAYSTSVKLSQIEDKYQEFRRLSLVGESNAMSKLSELRGLLATGNPSQTKENAIYSGYLLAELDDSKFIGKFSDLIDNYRVAVESSTQPIVVQSIGLNLFPYALPVKVVASSSEPDAVSKDGLYTMQQFYQFVDKNPAIIIGQSSPENRSGLVKIWRGRSLVVVAQKPEEPFWAGKYKSFSEYVKSNTMAYDPHMQFITDGSNLDAEWIKGKRP